MNNAENEIFPLFLNISNKKIFVVGSGNIATRRIKTLLRFNSSITVVSCGKLEEELINQVLYINREFSQNDVANFDIVLATTDDRVVNNRIYHACKKEKILVNVCDNPQECDFYFPAIFENQDIIGGLVSKGGNKHKLVKETAKQIRGVL